MKKILVLTALFFLVSGCQRKTVVVGKIWDDIPDISIVDRDLDTSKFAHLSAAKVAWGIGKEVDENNQPVDCINANEKYGKYDAEFVKEPNHEVYLTFDNGYENGNTYEILDVLKEKDVQALFFLTSQYVLENPDLVQRMIDEGHLIGNHSWHHHSFPEISMNDQVKEIVSLDDLLINQFQYKMNYIRPPKGEFSEQSLAVSQALGYTTLLWSVAYYDYNVNDQPDHEKSLKKLLDMAHPGAIYLLHSVSDTNAAILKDLIDGLRNLNYKMGSFD